MRKSVVVGVVVLLIVLVGFCYFVGGEGGFFSGLFGGDEEDGKEVVSSEAIVRLDILPNEDIEDMGS